uniref:NADH-ubiquinone oxidoreductase chain 4 n=1 Tax=Postharmostomum commutatum TaxID=2336775 RepID=A0A5C1D7U6_9TREM|nr:NADH dehydrogenase subunit 4 [Postharmostomum commutatum]QEL51322.1 NADH dehydrogenase subunit 4 [Postharmostomum commutatum]
MKFGKFDWYSGSLVFGVLLSVYLVVNIYSSVVWWGLGSCTTFSSGGYFMFDIVSFYLTLLTIILGMLLIFSLSSITLRCVIFLGLSLVSGILSYCVSHALLFWGFYEVSILSLLYLLVAESPYSERFIAGWYLVGYVVFTSLPMLLILLYLSGVCGSFNFMEWCNVNSTWYSYNWWLLVLLGILFITKIPLFPFHVWLPLVHAEASSAVSICLSGYIMKLGLLGVYRFCSVVLVDGVFSEVYLGLLLVMALIFFAGACSELDGKRWLALLSLSHIVIAAVIFYAAGYFSSGLVYVYSVGHGLSAGLVFMVLWWCYELSGTRNWNVLKFVLGGSLLFRCLIVVGLCTVASLPTSLQFFCEVQSLSDLADKSCIVFVFFCVYLFFSSLVPFFLLGGLLSRHFSVVQVSSGVEEVYLLSSVFWGLISFLLFVLI